MICLALCFVTILNGVKQSVIFLLDKTEYNE